MKRRKYRKRKLEAELRTYTANGVRILLEGKASNPESVANACCVAEHGTYMRDYVLTEEGILDQINFNFVRERE